MFDDASRGGGDDDGEGGGYFPRTAHAILVGRKVVLERDPMAWALWFETADRHVAQARIGAAYISTVFLGIDHGCGNAPEWFETMIFHRGRWCCGDAYQTRYASWEAAELGHAIAVEAERRGLWGFVRRLPWGSERVELARVRIWSAPDEGGNVLTSHGWQPLAEVFRNRRRVQFRGRTLARHFAPQP